MLLRTAKAQGAEVGLRTVSRGKVVIPCYHGKGKLLLKNFWTCLIEFEEIIEEPTTPSRKYVSPSGSNKEKSYKFSENYEN